MNGRGTRGVVQRAARRPGAAGTPPAGRRDSVFRLGAVGREVRRLTSQVVLLALFLQASGAAELQALALESRLEVAQRSQLFEASPRPIEPPPTFGDRVAAATADAAADSWDLAAELGARAVGRVAALTTAAQEQVEEIPQQIGNWLELLKDQAPAGTEPTDAEAVRAPVVPRRSSPPMPPGLRAPPPTASFGLAGASVPGGGSAALVDLTQVPLVPGANLISLPNEPPDSDPAVVLAAIAGQFTAAFAYDNCDAVDPWKVYDPADLPGSDLTAIDHKLGLWIDATAATTLPSDGVQPPTTQIQLCTGWNLIGYPLMQERPVPAALASIEGKYLRVFGFDVTDTVDGWEVYDVAAPDWANDLQLMQPGRGYWVLVTEDVLLDYENQGAPPAVDILSPAPRAEIASIVDVVGTVQSNLLDQWTLAYRESGTTVVGATWTVFASGDTPVTAAVLGQLDPTLLLNGMYDIRLQATDFQGQIVETIVPVAVDGGRKVGAFTLSFSDLQVPLSGLDVEVIRTYDSRDKTRGDFGVGWNLDIKQGSWENNIVPGDGWEVVNSPPPFSFPCVAGVETKAHLTTVRLSDEEIYRFRLEVFNTGPQLGGCFGRARFAFVDGPVPGATLTILGNTDVFWGSGTDFLLDLLDVTLYDPTNVRLRTRDGREFDFVLGQGVTSVRDTNGNELTITPTSISHSSGVSISMTRDSEDRIVDITDPMGQSLAYEYDAAGDLVTFTDRTGAATTFTYDAGHGLLDVFDPLGNRFVRNDFDAAGRLISSTDSFGNTIDFSRDPDARREVVTNRLGAVSVLEYDERGNVIRSIDPLGEETVRTFDAEDNPLTETDPLGRTTTFTYSPQQDLTGIVDDLGNATTFTYDSEGRVLTTTDPRGGVTTNVYDAAGNLLSETDALGNQWTFTYDANGNQLSRTDPLARATTFIYDGRGNLTSQTDALGNVTTYTYDANGNRISESRERTLPGGGTETLTTTFAYDEYDRLLSEIAPGGSIRRQSYDDLGRVVSRTDPLGRVTSMSFDGQGRLVSTAFPDGTAISTTYDAEGQARTRTDRAGRVTSLAYDAKGQPTTTRFADGTTITNGYDEAGQLTTIVDQRSNATSRVYDDGGRQIETINALGETTEVAYDAAGNQTSVTDARGNVTTFTYDALNRLTSTAFPDGTTTTIGYDALGRRTSETDQAGRTTQFAYDLLGRLTTVTDALGQTTSYTYDEVGNRLTQTDAAGRVTSFTYDAAGRMLSRTLPDGAGEVFTYNLDGTLATRTDFLGRTTSLSYDVNARLVRRDHPDGTSVTWTYTPTGQVASFIDTRGVTSFTYDARDRVTSMTYPDGRRLDYTYDPAGNRTALTATAGASILTTSYAYDALDRIATVTDSSGGVYSHGYDAVGNRTSLTYPSGVTTSTMFDAVNRLSLMTTATSGGSTLQNYSFTLDPTGRRTRIDEGDGTSRAYTYDALYRLTQDLVTDGAAALVYQQDYAYDPVGNRLSLAEDTGGGPVVTSYTYDARDRLLTEDAVTYGYDANGNLLSKAGTANYAWDTQDRLTSTTLADGTEVVTFYDPDGNRVRTDTTPPGGPTDTVHYLVDTSGPLSHVVLETDGTGNMLAHYERGDELLSLLRPAAVERRYYHADGLGSVRLLTDASEAVTDSYTYTAFGVELEHTGTDIQPYRFTAEPFDPNLGFHYNRARWLDAGTGRFLGMDPFPGLIAEPMSLHRYLYARADPVNVVDPSGEYGALVNLGITMLVGGIINAIIGIAFGNSPSAENFWGEFGKDFAVGALTAPVGGIFSRILAPIARVTMRPILSLIGRMDRIILTGKGPLGRMLVNISRFFFNTNKRYPPVNSTIFGRIMKRAFPNIRWEQHHVFIQQAWSRGGSTKQIFDDVAANEGLRRIGNGLWNLLPIPRGLNNYLGRSELGTQLLATAYYSVVVFGPWQAATFLLGDD